jgi:AhpD family alkylhydroperoxidase
MDQRAKRVDFYRMFMIIFVMSWHVRERRYKMKDFHPIFTKFKEDFPKVHEMHEALGKEIHENSGPLDDKTRWKIKIAISGACKHGRALETHIKKARAAGITDEEIEHTLLLLIPTVGFPSFMEAYSVFADIS